MKEKRARESDVKSAGRATAASQRNVFLRVCPPCPQHLVLHPSLLPLASHWSYSLLLDLLLARGNAVAASEAGLTRGDVGDATNSAAIVLCVCGCVCWMAAFP